MIGLRLNNFNYMKELMILADGKEKQESTKVLIKNKKVHYLIIDRDIANHLVL